MIKLDDKELKRFESDLKAFAHRAFPFATRRAIHTYAVKARQIAHFRIKQEFINRNAFTAGKALQFYPSSSNKITLNVNRQEAIVGSTADYMEDQEFGTTKVKQGKRGVPLPTSEAASQGRASPRTRLPTRNNKLANIQLKKKQRSKGKNKKQNLIIAVQGAVHSNNRFIYLDKSTHGVKRGIFRVEGGGKTKKRKTIQKRGWPKGAKLSMMYDLSHDSVTINRKPWLAPTIKRTEPLMAGIYKESIIFQLKRHKLFVG